MDRDKEFRGSHQKLQELCIFANVWSNLLFPKPEDPHQIDAQVWEVICHAKGLHNSNNTQNILLLLLQDKYIWFNMLIFKHIGQ